MGQLVQTARSRRRQYATRVRCSWEGRSLDCLWSKAKLDTVTPFVMRLRASGDSSERMTAPRVSTWMTLAEGNIADRKKVCRRSRISSCSTTFDAKWSDRAVGILRFPPQESQFLSDGSGTKSLRSGETIPDGRSHEPNNTFPKNYLCKDNDWRLYMTAFSPIKPSQLPRNK
jgi:hypothetical protein